MNYKVVICGSTFGSMYVEAIKHIPNIELIGILSTGSNRSKQLAIKENIKIFTKVDQIPDDISIGIVAIKSSILGGHGTEIAKSLLNKKINVIQEHPLSSGEIIECYKLSIQNGVKYKIGDLYSRLDSVKTFIKTANLLNNLENIEHISVLTSSQGLYSLISILAKAVNDFGDFQISNKGEANKYPFANIIGKINNTTVHIQIHNEVDDKHPNDNMHILHRVIFFYESGRLELNDTFGSVIWRSRMNILNFNDTLDDSKNSDVCYVVCDEKEIDYSELMNINYPIAIAEDIISFIDCINSKDNSINAQKDFLVSDKWSECTKISGFPKSINYELKHFNIIDLLKEQGDG